MSAGRAFTKMHGLGNDFVIVDARQEPFQPSPEALRRIADRRRGVGYDQLIVIGPPQQAEDDAARLTFWNADGTESGACGNGTRCTAWLLLAELGVPSVRFSSRGGELICRREPDGRMTVDLGHARSDWKEIPLARKADSRQLKFAKGPLKDPAALSLGNPHVTFFVEDAEKIDLATLGREIEHDPLFPERVNVGIAQLLGPDELRVRVWERGVGITQACGTGAAAAAVNASRRGLVGRKVRTRLDGGELFVWWREYNHVEITGQVAVSFTGTLAPDLLA
jgi:diaminopimelate epimerase